MKILEFFRKLFRSLFGRKKKTIVHTPISVGIITPTIEENDNTPIQTEPKPCYMYTLTNGSGDETLFNIIDCGGSETIGYAVSGNGISVELCLQYATKTLGDGSVTIGTSCY